MCPSNYCETTWKEWQKKTYPGITIIFKSSSKDFLKSLLSHEKKKKEKMKI